jgi:hypothetical protein
VPSMWQERTAPVCRLARVGTESIRSAVKGRGPTGVLRSRAGGMSGLARWFKVDS